MANSNYQQIQGFSMTVAATGTPMSVADGIKSNVGYAANQFAFDVVIQCPSGNTSAISIGNREGQGFSIAKGASIRLSTIMNRMSQSARFVLSELFVKVGTNGDKAEILLVGPDADQDA